jgi:hypothetical protein
MAQKIKRVVPQANADEPPFQELEAGLIIDEHALDEALLTQADSFYRVAQRLATLISERDGAKQHLEEVEARVDAKVRHDAEVAGEKITEREVASQKSLHHDVQKANKDLLDLSYEVGLASALKEAFQQRSYALGKLTDLYIAGYFGSDVRSSGATQMKNSTGAQAKQALDHARRSQT